MAETHDDASQPLRKIARDPGLVEDTPPALLELVDYASDEDPEDEVS